ncbi:MAG: hypothetical protein COA67_06795 [Lutibacter sp.]|nr:MAG: hypothetical protein COA67_06795 [Lutibacter sp.]
MKEKTIFIIFVIFTVNFYGQTFKGKVTYNVENINIGSTKLKQETPKQKKIFAHVIGTFELIKKLQLQLLFDDKNSYFHSIDELIKDGENEFLYKTARLVSKTKSNYFYSKNDMQLIEKKESFGEIFLISKKIDVRDWELVNETKKIGKYLCYKAKRIVTIITRQGDKDVNQTVWYSPEIPISFGPKEFVGFPGLVLQVLDGNIQYTATEIALNPVEKIEIKAIRGKVISEREYRKATQKSIDNTNSFFKK